MYIYLIDMCMYNLSIDKYNMAKTKYGFVHGFIEHAKFVSLSEAPEEEYDPRSLFERLQEQKEKKQEEFEEQFKFSKLLCLC